MKNYNELLKQYNEEELAIINEMEEDDRVDFVMNEGKFVKTANGRLNATSTTHNLKISYTKSDDSTFWLNIPDYKTNITPEEISDGAKEILAQNVFTPGGLSLITADHGKLVDTTTTEYVIE